MTRGIANDLSGQRFGHLEVKGRNGSDSQGNALWLCKCDCGNEVSIRSAFLIKRQCFCSKQCALYRSGMQQDLAGKRFAKLTAISLIKASGKYGKTIWAFRCDCGSQVELQATNVLTGHTQSCGCYGEASRIKHGQSQTRAYHRQAHREWAKRNPAKAIANALKRTKALRERIPKWLTEDHWIAINAFYLEAARRTAETGIVHHVDHKYPLRGKTVSGLHVPWNLQILTCEENLRKAARIADEIC